MVSEELWMAANRTLPESTQPPMAMAIDHSQYFAILMPLAKLIDRRFKLGNISADVVRHRFNPLWSRGRVLEVR
jgi:hypothetical protein